MDKTCNCRGMIILVAISVTLGETIVKVGNEVAPARTGLPSANTILLLKDEIQEPGVLFAWSAFFRGYSKGRFQTWRPVPGQKRNYTLVAEINIEPSVINQREDVYIESRFVLNCIKVEPGDRIGMFIEEEPSSVGYKFDVTYRTSVHGVTLPQGSQPMKPGESITFDPLVFPYVLSMAAYIDTNMSRYDATQTRPKCFPGLLIPEYDPALLPSTTTTPLPTGRPGDTGPQGPKGDTGDTGTQGPAGVPGLNGTDGQPGGIGATGPEGPMGPVGATGAAGKDGKDGAVGPMGPQGLAGSPGAAGMPGMNGLPGQPGRDGSPGKDGINRTVVVYSPDAKAVEVDPFLGITDFQEVATIWLIVISAVLLFLVILVAALCCKKKTEPYNPPFAYVAGSNPSTGGRPASVIDDPNWVNHMREESVTRYNPEIISGIDKSSLPEFHYDHGTLESKKRVGRTSSKLSDKPNGLVLHENGHGVRMNGSVVKDKNFNEEISIDLVNGQINDAFDGLDDSADSEVTVPAQRAKNPEDRTAL